MKSSLYTLPLLSLLAAMPVMAADSPEQESAKQAYTSPEIEVAVEAALVFRCRPSMWVMNGITAPQAKVFLCRKCSILK